MSSCMIPLGLGYVQTRQQELMLHQEPLLLRLGDHLVDLKVAVAAVPFGDEDSLYLRQRQIRRDKDSLGIQVQKQCRLVYP